MSNEQCAMCNEQCAMCNEQCTMYNVQDDKEKYRFIVRFDEKSAPKSAPALQPAKVQPSVSDKVMKFCPFCGEKLMPRASFCAFCGQKLSVL